MVPAEGQDPAVVRWVERLPGTAPEGADWTAYDEQPEALRREVVLALKGRVDHLVRNEPPAARAVADAAVRAARDLPDLLPLAVRGRGVAAHYGGDAAGARQAFEEAARLHGEQGQEVEQGRALRSLVDVHQMAGRTEEALACGRCAAELFERHGEGFLLAGVQLNLGNVYTRLDEYTQAEQHYAAARDGYLAAGREDRVAFAEFNLAVVAMNNNRCADAQAHWARARSGLEAADMALAVADCDYNTAYLESRLGRFEAALDGLERARRTYLENGKPSGPALCDLDLAEIHLRLGTLRDALDHADRAVAAFTDLEMVYELARSRVLAGVARARLGDARGASQDLAAARELFEQLGNVSFAHFVNLQQAQLAMAEGRAAEVLDDLRRDEAVLSQRGLRWLADLARLSLVRALLMVEQPAQALEVLAGLDGERDRLDGLLRSIALRLRADALLAAGDRDQALATLREAVDTIDDTWSQVPGGDVRIAFFRDQHPAFVDLAFLLLDAGRSEEALLVFEHGRSRSLLETSPRSEDPAWREARERLDWLLARQLDAELGPLAGGGSEVRHERDLAVSWTSEVDAARSELARLARRAPAAGGPAPAPLHEGDLLAARRADELLLVFLSGRQGVRALVIDGDEQGLEIVPRDLGLAEDELIALRDRFLFQLSRRGLGGRSEARLRRALGGLGERLLAPLSDLLNPGRPLVVVPYGPLHDLPVHAFERDGVPLVRDHAVSQAVSLWHLARLRRRPAPARDQATCWCAGAPLGVLPAIARELDALQDQLGARVRRLEPEALLSALGEGGLDGSLLHVAGHGRFEATRPRFSALCLGERFLLAHDVAAMSLDVDLVTLSGCDTGRKLTTGGDELIGLPRALLGAGARAVLGSLWPVHDEAAEAFMAAFYGAYGDGRDARSALHAAQQDMLDRSADPTSWAAFSLLGDPDVSLPDPNGRAP